MHQTEIMPSYNVCYTMTEIHGILFTAGITITEEVRVQYGSRTVANYSIFRLLELSLV